jgi:hypothetical protein
MGGGIQSIAPARLVTPFVDIFSPRNQVKPNGLMEVSVSRYTSDGEIHKFGQKLEMTLEDYNRARKLSKAVYRMIPDVNTSSPNDEFIYMGTAFHIGENLVLTNHHVLSHDRTNSTECAGFQLHGNESSHVFACKKVHYCNVEHDVCLIEMAPAVRCLNFFCSKKELVELKHGESIKLKANPIANFDSMDHKVMTCIGNTMGLGIHYSQGRGLQITSDRAYFFAPLRTGNSGGPLIAEDGLAWGVVKLESAAKVSDEAYNVAVPMEKVIALMQEQLTKDKITLDKFNRSIEQ